MFAIVPRARDRRHRSCVCLFVPGFVRTHRPLTRVPSPAWRKLSTGNNIGDDGASAVAHALLGNTSLRRLDMSCTFSSMVAASEAPLDVWMCVWIACMACVRCGVRRWVITCVGSCARSQQHFHSYLRAQGRRCGPTPSRFAVVTDSLFAFVAFPLFCTLLCVVRVYTACTPPPHVFGWCGRQYEKNAFTDFDQLSAFVSGPASAVSSPSIFDSVSIFAAASTLAMSPSGAGVEAPASKSPVAAAVVLV